MTIGFQSLNRHGALAVTATTQRAVTYRNTTWRTESELEMLALGATPGDEAFRHDLTDANGNPIAYKLMREPAHVLAHWVAQGGGAAVAQVHGGAVATWAALPAAGTFIGETRDVADLAGNAQGMTGAGVAVWRGASVGWEPEGGTPAPLTGGADKHAVLSVTVAATTFAAAINAAAAGYTHTGDTTLFLGADAAAFVDVEAVEILLNGRSVKLDARLAFTSPTSFTWSAPVGVGDVWEIRTP